MKNAKNLLQELHHREYPNFPLPSYISESSGPPHDLTWTATVVLSVPIQSVKIKNMTGQTFKASSFKGEPAKTKTLAEMNAAQVAIDKLGHRNTQILTNRRIFGPIVRDGCLALPSSTGRCIRISAGSYHVGDLVYKVDDMDPVSLTILFGDNKRRPGVSNVPLWFDNNGRLTDIPGGFWTYHTLYVLGAEILVEHDKVSYILVLNTKFFASEDEAIEAAKEKLPTPASFVDVVWCPIANIVVTWNDRFESLQMSRFVDIRPKISFSREPSLAPEMPASRKLRDDAICVLIDYENLPNMVKIVSDIIDDPENNSDIDVFAFVGIHHHAAENALPKGVNKVLVPASRSDAVDTCMQVFVGVRLAYKTYQEYIIVTRDHFGVALVDIITSDIYPGDCCGDPATLFQKAKAKVVTSKSMIEDALYE